MHAAYNQAENAFQKDEVPVGAVIFDPINQMIISAAHNLTESTNDPTAHAEIIAIREACKKLNIKRLDGFDLYVTLEPCPMCAQAISLSRIRRLYFGAYDIKSGGVFNGTKTFTSTSCHYQPEVYAGIDEEKCGEILSRYFQSKR